MQSFQLITRMQAHGAGVAVPSSGFLCMSLWRAEWMMMSSREEVVPTELYD